MSTHNICFHGEIRNCEGLLMITHNIRFHREMRKIVTWYISGVSNFFISITYEA